MRARCVPLAAATSWPPAASSKAPASSNAPARAWRRPSSTRSPAHASFPALCPGSLVTPAKAGVRSFLARSAPLDSGLRWNDQNCGAVQWLALHEKHTAFANAIYWLAYVFASRVMTTQVLDRPRTLTGLTLPSGQPPVMSIIFASDVYRTGRKTPGCYNASSYLGTVLDCIILSDAGVC